MNVDAFFCTKKYFYTFSQKTNSFPLNLNISRSAFNLVIKDQVTLQLTMCPASHCCPQEDPLVDLKPWGCSETCRDGFTVCVVLICMSCIGILIA